MLVIGMAAALFACKKEGAGKQVQVMSTAKTQVVRIDSVQMAFDLQTMEEHKKMMEHMKVTMDHQDDADRVLSLTLMEKPGNKLITDARITISINGPGGLALNKPAMVMKGGGMFHYIVDFKTAGSGKYPVSAVVRRGDVEYKPQVEFNIQ